MLEAGTSLARALYYLQGKVRIQTELDKIYATLLVRL